jgi:hypothetical protein
MVMLLVWLSDMWLLPLLLLRPMGNGKIRRCKRTTPNIHSISSPRTCFKADFFA